MENTKKCAQCNNDFSLGHWNKKFCGDACRASYWEQQKTAIKSSKSSSNLGDTIKNIRLFLTHFIALFFGIGGVYLAYLVVPIDVFLCVFFFSLLLTFVGLKMFWKDEK